MVSTLGASKNVDENAPTAVKFATHESLSAVKNDDRRSVSADSVGCPCRPSMLARVSQALIAYNFCSFITQLAHVRPITAFLQLYYVVLPCVRMNE